MARPPPFHKSWPRVPSHVNDNYCVQCATGLKDCVCVPRQLDLNPSPVVTKDKIMTSKSKTVFLHVNSCVANVHSVTGLPQKKGLNPSYCPNYTEIKYVKNVSCVGHLSSANLVTNVPTVAINPPVGTRLQQFWEKWEALGSSPKVVIILREGYTLPFRFSTSLVGESHIPPNLSPAYTDLGSSLSRTRLAGEQGLLTATEKQVHLDRLHMRPIQWHLKNNWRVPESLEKVIPVPRSLAPPPLKVVAGGKQCSSRSTITPTKTCSADIYRRIKRRVGCSL